MHPLSAAAPTRAFYTLTHVLGIPLLLACAAWLAAASGLDMRIARALYDPALDGFPLRAHRWLELFGHRLALALPVGMALIAVALAAAGSRIAAWRPLRRPALALALTCIAGQVLVHVLKHHTTMPRPYDLATLGGKTPYPGFWWTWARAYAGGALPSGHAGAGYSMLALYFAGWSRQRRALRWGGLALGLAAGLGFSAVRILQGAHFLSQTLYSATLLWLLAAVFFYPLIVAPPRQAATDAPRTHPHPG